MGTPQAHRKPLEAPPPQQYGPAMKPAHRTLLVWTLLLALLVGATTALSPEADPPPRPYDTFATAMVAGDIDRVEGLAQPEILDWLQSTGMPVTQAEERDSPALLLGLGLVALSLMVDLGAPVRATSALLLGWAAG